MMTTSIESISGRSFDYVVIGGGTAGLTLAARLSEDSTKSVLVLEAGEANLQDPNLLRSASYGSHFGNPSYTWGYQTAPQKHMNDRQLAWHRGKGLGGSSGINFLCWTKPPAQDIDAFETLGNRGWNWNNYEKYLERTEGFVEPNEKTRKDLNLRLDTWKIGREGPLLLSFPATIDPAEVKIQQTFLNSGIPVAPRPLSGNPNGAFFIPNTYDPYTHTRSYATTAFYLPNKDRPNLTVITSAPVRHVLIERVGNGRLSATGVVFEHDGKPYSVNAREEVILSAGALQSPHILELSGIGRKEVLEKVNIPAKLDLPGVGENVQEHIFIGTSWELRDDVQFDTLDGLRDPAIAAQHLELHASGSGLFTMGIVGFAFTTLDIVTSNAKTIYQSMKALVASLGSKISPGLLEQYQLQLGRFEPGKGSPNCEFISFPGLLSRPNPPVKGKRYVTIIAATNHPFSRGTIHTVSDDPSKDPEYDPHYYEQSVDLDVHTEMVKFVRKMADVAPLKDMIAKELNPGPDVKTDEQLQGWMKANVNSTWHTAGSCSMLPLEKGGVVDPDLKVYGTNNLRVVDLSVVPLHFASHPQATVYAIAEQAADIIKGNFTT